MVIFLVNPFMVNTNWRTSTLVNPFMVITILHPIMVILHPIMVITLMVNTNWRTSTLVNPIMVITILHPLMVITFMVKPIMDPNWHTSSLMVITFIHPIILGIHRIMVRAYRTNWRIRILVRFIICQQI